jgi:parallel beta-helix repeat protein
MAADTLYVDRGDPSCTDAGVGSASQPFCTIGAAAARAVAGQSVVVASGTYLENVSPANSGAPDAPIVFTTAPGADVTVTGQTHGFTLSGRRAIAVQGFTVTGTTGDGVYVADSADITLTDVHVSYSGRPNSVEHAKGIRLSGVTGAVIARNTIDYNSDYGIYLVNSTGVQVLDNESSDNARVFERMASGIRLFGSSGNLLAGNVVHDNEDSGIELSGLADDNLIVNNASYRNDDHGIDVLDSTGQWIVANSVYENVTAGINVERSPSGALLANNISVDNGVASPRATGNVRVDSTAIPSTSIDYDLVFLHQGNVMLVWGATAYESLAEFQAATGQEQHGLEADPLWVAADLGISTFCRGRRPSTLRTPARADSPTATQTEPSAWTIRALRTRGSGSAPGTTAARTSSTPTRRPRPPPPRPRRRAPRRRPTHRRRLRRRRPPR